MTIAQKMARALRVLAFGIDCACVAAGLLVLISIIVFGFDLAQTTRIWGQFLLRLSQVTPQASQPVTLVVGALWAALTALMVIARRPAFSTQARDWGLIHLKGQKQ
jgi:TRAP-type C4-dicarboxylate transport system permease small subunit